MKHTNYLLGAILAFFCFAACEDMEETYDEYAGDGPIRYLAKCTDVEALSGWERLTVKWKNHLDPNRNGIWINCTSELYQFDTLVGPSDTVCDIRGLKDATYTVKVAAVSEQGDTSVVQDVDVVTGRPYTLEHEAVRGYTRGFSKSFFLKDNLVLFTSRKTADMVKFTINYTRKSDGMPEEYDLTANMSKTNLRIEDIDLSKDIVLHRLGKLEGCADTIPFPEYKITENRTPLADFETYLLERYGWTSIDYNVTELDLDYDLESLEDLLYFPNLKTVNLDKNRYYSVADPAQQVYSIRPSELTGGYSMETRRDFCIELLQEVNPELKINAYGFGYNLPYGVEPYFAIFDEGLESVTATNTYPELPTLTYLDTEGMTVTARKYSEEIATSLSETDRVNLFDDDPETMWSPVADANNDITELVIDLGEEKIVSGLTFIQADVNNYIQNMIPVNVTVEVSSDNRTWTNPLYTSTVMLGNNAGEVKLMEFPDGAQKIRYVRLTVSDVYYDASAGTAIGSIRVFE